jgi:hypothetical protein
MTQEPSSIAAVRRAAERAVRAWRLSRAMQAAQVGFAVALAAAAACALGIELGTVDGLGRGHLGSLAAWLGLVPLFGLGGALRPLTQRRAVHELDQRAGLADRLGTALAFADHDSPLARFQRADAAHFADVAVAPLFPLRWRERAPLLLGLGLLLGLIIGAGLGFDLGPRPAPVVVEVPDSADDLLAAIELEKELLLERDDKEGVRLLEDMTKEIRRFKARRDELERRLARRQPDAVTPPPVAEPERLPEPAAAEPQRQPDRDLITAADLERLEATTLSDVQMTDTQTSELVAELFSSTRAANQMNEQFHHFVEGEMDAMTEAARPSLYGTGENSMQKLSDKMDSMDMLNMGAQSDRLTDQADVEGKGMDMIRRDLGGEAQAAHDGAHDMQKSFNDFLQDFVKDMQQTVAETALGKKPGKNAREVKTNAPGSMPDKRDAMAESGFEEMSDSKAGPSQAPPEPGQGEAGGDSGGEPGQQGPPPDDLSNMQLSDGDPGDNAVAMKSDSSGGKTSAGASGAGTGDASQAGRSGTLQGLARLNGPLDEVLGALGEGALPSDERKQLFDRLARHSVQAGLASEADDVLLDYFEQAEELISEEEELSPLFRDYATSYFEAIRPGGARADAASRPPVLPPGDDPPAVP